MPDTRQNYDQVSGLYLPIGIGVVVLIVLLVVFMALRYRVRETSDGGGGAHRPSRIANAPRAEAIYAVVLACVVALLLWRTFTTEAREDHPSAVPAATVDITAAKWHWRFDYRGTGVSQLGSDLVGPTLVVPAGEPVRFTLVAVDVIHAFWIPLLRFKRDANPGLRASFELSFPNVGYFPNGGECSEFCGLGHARMTFNLEVLAPAAYARWLSGREHGALTGASR